MRRRFWRHGFKTINFTASLLLFLTAGRGSAQDFFAGVRGGGSFDSTQGQFYQTEAFAGWKIPWRWDFYSNWTLRPGLDTSAGWITGHDADGFVGTAGPFAELHFGKFPVVLEGGGSPTWLSHHVFGQTNFGEQFQFTSHIGLEWDVTKNFTVGCRFQHMSNAGLASPNPGVNFEMLSFRYNF